MLSKREFLCCLKGFSDLFLFLSRLAGSHPGKLPDISVNMKPLGGADEGARLDADFCSHVFLKVDHAAEIRRKATPEIP